MNIPAKHSSKHSFSKADIHALAHIPDPYSMYRWMREQGPIKGSPDASGWILSRHADIVSVLRDERFGFVPPVLTLPSWHELVGADKDNASPRGTSPQVSRLEWLRLQSKAMELRQLWILLLNPPSHTRLRGLVQPHFNHTTVAGWHLDIQKTADALLEPLQKQSEMDLIHDFAGPLALSVTLKILGIPSHDAARFNQWSRNLGHFLYAQFVSANSLEYHRMCSAAIGLTEYFRNLVQARQEPYGDDVIDTLIRAKKADMLSDDELLAMCILLSLGGYSTTRSQIGNGMLALLRHREQWELLQLQPELVAGAVEECMRYDAPGQTAGRSAFTDVNLNGIDIKKGDWVNLLLGAGNRDPDAFPEPERFDITRSPNPHLAFGHGIHYCLGAHLARATTRIALSTLSRRLPQMALRDDSIEWATDQHLRGLKALHLVF